MMVLLFVVLHAPTSAVFAELANSVEFVHAKVDIPELIALNNPDSHASKLNGEINKDKSMYSRESAVQLITTLILEPTHLVLQVVRTRDLICCWLWIGKELSDTTNLYIYQEMSTNFLSLIHLNDKARDNTGGRVKAVYSYTR